MGDLSAEPSMEDILSSIKRIIAEEGEAPTRQRRQPRAASPAVRDEDEADTVLELSDPIPDPTPAPKPAVRASEPKVEAMRAESENAAEPIVSRQAADASRGALENLSRMLVKPEAGSDGTLESLVREMLRPMLRDWLDSNLPAMVEQMVSREIARIAGHD